MIWWILLVRFKDRGRTHGWFLLSHISSFISHKGTYFISSKKMSSLHVLCSTLHHSLCLRPCDCDVGCFSVLASVSRCYPFCYLLGPPLGVLTVSPRPHTFSFHYSSLSVPIVSCMLSTVMALKHISSSMVWLPAHVILCLCLFSGMLTLPKAKLLHHFCRSYFHIPFFQLPYYLSYFDIKY